MTDRAKKCNHINTFEWNNCDRPHEAPEGMGWVNSSKDRADEIAENIVNCIDVGICRHEARNARCWDCTKQGIASELRAYGREIELRSQGPSDPHLSKGLGFEMGYAQAVEDAAKAVERSLLGPSKRTEREAVADMIRALGRKENK